MNAEIIANISSENLTDVKAVKNVLEKTDNPELHYAFAVLLHENSVESYREEIINHLTIASKHGHSGAKVCLKEWFGLEFSQIVEGSN